MEKIIKAIGELDCHHSDDSIIFDGKLFLLNLNNFSQIKVMSEKTVSFIDGGQAEIIKAPNFSLQFIRVVACTFKGRKRVTQEKNEFYTLVTTGGEEVNYKAQIFQLKEKQIEKPIDSFEINSMDETVRQGTERASLSSLGSMARRFAELEMASRQEADFVVLDGKLEQSYKGEDKYLDKLKENACAIAKESSVFTLKGNSASDLLNKMGPKGIWYYPVTEKTSFVKLHPKSDFVFRFEGCLEALPSLAAQSNDPVFLGYPYGLIWADRTARVSNAEKEILKTKFMVKLGIKEMDAHGVLDRISF